MHVDDLARGCLFLMDNWNNSGFLNIGTGNDISILELAKMIKNITGYSGNIINDLTKPDGTPRKLMDVTNIERLGWKAEIELNEGIKSVYLKKFKHSVTT